MIKRLIHDALLWAGIWFGLYNQVEYVDSAVVFYMWFIAVTVLFASFVPKKELSKIKPRTWIESKYIPLSVVVESVVVAGVGMYWLAGIYLVFGLVFSFRVEEMTSGKT